MNRRMRGAIVAALALGSLGLVSTEASAIPAQNLAPVVAEGAAAAGAAVIEKAYVVCGPFRCVRRGWGWRRPFYGYRRGWGWRRGWRRW